MANNTSIHVLQPSTSCYHLPDPTFHKVSKRYTVNLITAVINIVTAPFAVISNLLIFLAIVFRLRRPSKLLIGSLALSDVFVGLAVPTGLHRVPTHGKSASFGSVFCHSCICKSLLHLLWSGFYDTSGCQL